MKNHRALLLTLFATALALAPACRNTAEGVKEDSRQNKEKARDTAHKIGDEAEDVAGKVAEGAKDAGEKIKEGAQTVDVKAALMLDQSIDASHIDVDTDANTKTVTLKGTVPTAAQKAAAETVARENAVGYQVRNLLTVKKK